MRCTFCHTPLKAELVKEHLIDKKVYKCPTCGTIVPRETLVYPYKYTVGNTEKFMSS